MRLALLVTAAACKAAAVVMSLEAPNGTRVDHCGAGGAVSNVIKPVPLVKEMGPIVDGPPICPDRAQTNTRSALAAEAWCTDAASTLSPAERIPANWLAGSVITSQSMASA